MKLLNPILLFFSFMLIATSCGNDKATSQNEIPDDNLELAVIDTDTDHALETIEESSFKEYYEYANAYPMDVNLFEDAFLNERISNLMGKDYEDFKMYWETETPIIIEEGILFTTGCEQHNCFGNQFVLILDLENDNVNVFRLGQFPEAYEEKGTIKLPKKINSEFSTMLDNLS